MEAYSVVPYKNQPQPSEVMPLMQEITPQSEQGRATMSGEPMELKRLKAVNKG